MVLKKPYAFLIKHFRLIHIVLTVLTIVVAVESYRILTFFSDYIANNYSVTIIENMVGEYIGSVIYLAIVAILILLIVIAILLKMKSKPIKTYVYSGIYYLILIILVAIASILIAGLERQVWSTASAKAYRDIAVMVYYPQFIFIVLLIIRTIGFDVKKFNFKDDLRELEITDADSEEIELNVNFDSTKTKRNVRRFVRETGYYYQENKFILTIIAIIGIIVVAFTIYKNYEKNIFRYNEGGTFNLGGLNIKVVKSMVTDLNTKGDKIRDGSAFLVLLVEVTNNSNRDLDFKYDYLRLINGSKAVLPDLSLSSYFADYGGPVTGSKIYSRKSNKLIIPYEIDKSDINNSFKISVYLGDATKKKRFVAKTAYIKLSPKKYMGTSKSTYVRVGNEITFDKSLLGETTFKVDNPEFTTRYVYYYDRCFNNECNKKMDIIVSDATYLNRNALIVLDYSLVFDQNSPSFNRINTTSTFANAFFKLEYGNDRNKMNATTVKYATPANLNDKLVLQTEGSVLSARKVNLIVSVRNKEYTIMLKDN